MRKSFLSILGLLVTVMVMVFLAYLLMKAYLFRQPATPGAQEVMPQNIEGLNQYKANAIDHTRSVTSDINKRIRQQQEDIDTMLR